MRILSLILALSGSLSAATQNVSSGNFFFSPNSININAGDTVQWSGLGSGHNVAQSTDAGSNSYDGSGFRSGDTNSGVSNYSFQFNTPGTYFYVCENHAGANMKGQVVVAAAATPTPSPLPSATVTLTPTLSPTPSISATFTVSPTLTVTLTITMSPTLTHTFNAVQLAEYRRFMPVLGPVPAKRGQALCLQLSANFSALGGEIVLYNHAGERIAKQTVMQASACFETQSWSPGIYQAKIKIGEKTQWQRLAITP